MRRLNLLPLALVLALAGCPGDRAAPTAPPFRWVTRVLTPVPPPGEPALAAASLIQDLVYLPVGYVVPGLAQCVPDEACRAQVADGLAFHDGRPLDAAVVAERLTQGLAVAPDAIRAEGRDLVLRLPAAGLASAAELHLGSRSRDGGWIGTGPYRLVRNTDDLVELAAVDPGRRPQRILVERISDLREIIAALLSGEANFTDGVPGHQPRFIEATGVARIFVETSRVGLYVVFDPGHELGGSAIRPCLVGLMRAALDPHRERLELAAPAEAAPYGAQDLQGCAEQVRATLRGPQLEVPVASEAVTAAAEALIAGLGSLGIPVQARPIGLDELDDPLEAPMRITPLEPSHGVTGGLPASLLGQLRLSTLAARPWVLDRRGFEAAGRRWPLLFLVPDEAP